MRDKNKYYLYVLRNFSYFLFIAFCFLLIIGNGHFADNQYRTFEKLSFEVKKLKYDYIFKKTKLKSLTRRSQLRKELKDRELEEITEPPEFVKPVLKEKN